MAEYLTTRDLCESLGVSRQRISQMVKSGKLPQPCERGRWAKSSMIIDIISIRRKLKKLANGLPVIEEKKGQGK
jgi:excisionase family DNA binding protein